jgi:hypothetical protein
MPPSRLALLAAALPSAAGDSQFEHFLRVRFCDELL